MTKSSTVVVLLHGWIPRKAAMAGVKALARELYGTDTIFCEPSLGMRWALAARRATSMVEHVLKSIDPACGKPSVERIVFVGHSIGATILRRVFLVAAGRPDNFEIEPELRGQPRPWAHKVERIVLLAAFNRGWSVSERTSWVYSIGFNFVGAVGHLTKKEWIPGIYDFRLGAPFMVQTRLHWMAHRRRGAGDPAPQPFVVQIIGTQDDFIAPFDQVDISVDNATPRVVRHAGTTIQAVANVAPGQRNYFLLEMACTDHDTIVVLDDTNNWPSLFRRVARVVRPAAAAKRDARDARDAAARRDMVRLALAGSRADIGKAAVDPTLLCDQPAVVDTTVEETVFVIHGIRDDGFWTHRVAERIRRADPQRTLAFRSWTPTYGYFAMLPFMLSWIRRQKVEWFMDQYVNAFAQYPESNFHYVGHSNGTYLAAAALERYPAFHVQRMLFAGSVVRTTFDWNAYVPKRVAACQNIVASKDSVVAAFPKSVEGIRFFDLGGAGVDGFRKTAPGLHQFEYVAGGHGEGIREEHWDQIAAFIVNGTPMTRTGPPDCYADKPGKFVAFLGRSRCAIPVILILAWLLGWCVFALAHRVLPAWAVPVAIVAYLALLRFIVIRV